MLVSFHGKCTNVYFRFFIFSFFYFLVVFLLIKGRKKGAGNWEAPMDHFWHIALTYTTLRTKFCQKNSTKKTVPLTLLSFHLLHSSQRRNLEINWLFRKIVFGAVSCYFPICLTEFYRPQRINWKLCMGGEKAYHSLTIVQCRANGLSPVLHFGAETTANFLIGLLWKPQPLLPVLTVPFWSSLLKRNGPLCAAFLLFLCEQKYYRMQLTGL